jgi:hypothetical protein
VLADTVPSSKKYLDGTVLCSKNYLDRTVLYSKQLVDGTYKKAVGGWKGTGGAMGGELSLASVGSQAGPQWKRARRAQMRVGSKDRPTRHMYPEICYQVQKIPIFSQQRPAEEW